MSEELYYIDIPYYSNISRGGMFKTNCLILGEVNSIERL